MKQYRSFKLIAVSVWIGSIVALTGVITSDIVHISAMSDAGNLITFVYTAIENRIEGVRYIIDTYPQYSFFIVFGLYMARPFLFIPASFLTAFIGAIFGPVYGLIITLLGENLAANVSFAVARFMKGSLNTDDVPPLLSKIFDMIHNHQLLSVIMARFLWIPFDLVSYGFGVTGVQWKYYFLGTFIGTIPGMLALIFTGSSLSLGSSMFWLALLCFGLTFLAAFFCKKCMT